MHNLTIPLITLIMNIPKENLMKDFKKILMDIILVVRKKIEKNNPQIIGSIIQRNMLKRANSNDLVYEEWKWRGQFVKKCQRKKPIGKL